MTRAANVLFVCQRLVSPETNGLAVRVANVARQLSLGRLRCHVVVDARDMDGIGGVFTPASFEGLHAIPGNEPINPLRFFRLSDEQYRRRANPEGFERTIARLRAIASGLGTEIVIAASTESAEYARSIPGVICVADICDSPTLALERQWSVRPPKSVREAWSCRLERLRSKRLERSICRGFERVVAISQADTAAVARSAATSDRYKLVTIPNGVWGQLIRPPDEDPRSLPAVAFWGNLDFAPNESAVLNFYNNIFVPFLGNVRWHIIGPHAPKCIRQLPDRSSDIVVAGYVPNLAASLAGIPIMINPMIIGGGQKNKVLEAFALGLAVVSTRLGMSGIDAVAGEHFLEADDPRSFAAAIRSLLASPAKRRALAVKAHQLVLEKYTWDRVGGYWHSLIADLMERKARAA